MMTGQRRLRRRALMRAAGVLAGVLLVGACEGSNLFEGGVAEDPPTVEIDAPDSVESGTSFDVRITATSPRGVSFIDVNVVGDPTGSQRIDFDGTNELESTLVELTASSTIGATTTIEAFAQDVNGRNSATARATVQVTSPPTAGAE